MLKIDSSCQANILPTRDYQKLKDTPKLNSTNTKLTACNLTPIPVSENVQSRLHTEKQYVMSKS